MVALSGGAVPGSIHIATFAWERKRFDPQLGPRAAGDFRDLISPSAGVREVGGHSRLRQGRSFLPDLVREAGCHVYLLDPTDGVHGLRRQLIALGQYLGSRETFVVDVGGDILARGEEIGLRSPTADAMALAAADETGATTWIIAVGLGLDGELTRSQWREACRAGAKSRGAPERPRYLAESAATFVRPLLTWHPSEVAGLACLAALGYQGTAEVRADGLEVTVDRDAAGMHRFEHAWLMARNRVAQAVRNTNSLADVEAAVRETVGRTELDDEREMLVRRRHYSTDRLSLTQLSAFESTLLSYSDDAASRNVSFLTLRRVSELLGLSPKPFRQLCSYLVGRHPTRIQPPVWRCEAPGDHRPDRSSTPA
jgi:hypothetical protein